MAKSSAVNARCQGGIELRGYVTPRLKPSQRQRRAKAANHDVYRHGRHDLNSPAIGDTRKPEQQRQRNGRRHSALEAQARPSR